ncbi:MAG: hypothetical protein WCY84_00665 [Candidatus Cloacimonadaceae bacterium]
MKDFTVATYEKILKAFIRAGYKIVSVSEYLKNDNYEKALILRHDIDRYIRQVPPIIELETRLGISASYYVRYIPSLFQHWLLEIIVKNGHELGYHYEVLSQTARANPSLKNTELIDKAYAAFKNNLEEYKEYYPIQTITMHGDSLSKQNNLDLWEHHDYRELGIICEPYLDIDFSNIGYITDVGRAWNKASVNRRDLINGLPISVTGSNDLIDKIFNNELPALIMMNMHPEHWTDSNIRWLQLYMIRMVKNNLKRAFFK